MYVEWKVGSTCLGELSVVERRAVGNLTGIVDSELRTRQARTKVPCKVIMHAATWSDAGDVRAHIPGLWLSDLCMSVGNLSSRAQPGDACMHDRRKEAQARQVAWLRLARSRPRVAATRTRADSPSAISPLEPTWSRACRAPSSSPSAPMLRHFESQMALLPWPLAVCAAPVSPVRNSFNGSCKRCDPATTNGADTAVFARAISSARSSAEREGRGLEAWHNGTVRLVLKRERRAATRGAVASLCLSILLKIVVMRKQQWCRSPTRDPTKGRSFLASRTPTELSEILGMCQPSNTNFLIAHVHGTGTAFPTIRHPFMYAHASCPQPAIKQPPLTSLSLPPLARLTPATSCILPGTAQPGAFPCTCCYCVLPSLLPLPSGHPTHPATPRLPPPPCPCPRPRSLSPSSKPPVKPSIQISLLQLPYRYRLPSLSAVQPPTASRTVRCASHRTPWPVLYVRP